MYSSFTEPARRSVVLAEEEARILKHDYVGSEHLLLGLLRAEDDVAARVLVSSDITLTRVRAQVIRIVGSGDQSSSGPIPLTPRSKKVLQGARRETVALGFNYVGTEHILLALAREDESVAGGILRDFKIDLAQLRSDVVAIQPSPNAARGPRTASVPAVGDDSFPVAGRAPEDRGADALGRDDRLAAESVLTAAVLTRRAFEDIGAETLEPLQIQLLLQLALTPGTGQPVTSLETLATEMACNLDQIRSAAHALSTHRLATRYERDRHDYVAITARGAARARNWLLSNRSILDQ